MHSDAHEQEAIDGRASSCATMSSHTCYRTSRSFHFPFWAVCSLSGTQPEFSLGRLHPHVEKDILSLFVASSQFNVLRASTRVRPPPGPTWPGSTRAEAAQDGSEDVTVRSVSVRMRCLTDGLSSDNTVDFMHAFATPSRELRLA